MTTIGLSTSSVYPLGLEATFRIAKKLGYDGVEVMVTSNDATRDVVHIKELINKYHMPVLSVHAPVLMVTPFVWGRDPEIKLRRAASFADSIGADTVVVHPPFRWQVDYVPRFLATVAHVENSTDVNIAVENMFPWRLRGREHEIYSPNWETIVDNVDYLTIDFSHAALSGIDTLEFVKTHLNQVRHIHLCDGKGVRRSDKAKVFDEHLKPGDGNQPVAETLRLLADSDWDGHIVAEVSTKRYRSERKTEDVLRDTLRFARESMADGSA